MDGAFFTVFPDHTIDPSKAEAFLYHIVIREGWLAGSFSKGAQPNFSFGLVMGFQPFAPLASVMGVEDFGYFHGKWAFKSKTTPSI